MKNDFMSEVRESKARIDKQYEETKNIEKNLGKIHAEAAVPRPLGIDEVAFAFVAALRVSSWESLGDEFGGYKQGRLLAYILSVLNEKIEESTAATIRVDVPLYEQCPTVSCKCSGKCEVVNKETEVDEANYGKTLIKYLNQSIKLKSNLRKIQNLVNEPVSFFSPFTLFRKLNEKFALINELIVKALKEVEE